MASTNRTKNYKLNQWLGSDYMKRDDLNNDNELIDAALKNNADALSAEAAARSAGDSELRDLISSEAAARQAADEEINSTIKSGVTLSPSIGLGMNSVIRRSDGMTSIPKFTMQGKSYVNLLGKDGNCEDVSKWGTYQVTATLDSTNKVFGSNGIKATLTSTTGAVVKVLNTLSTLDYSKYYFVSAYLKNGNASIGIRVYKNNVGGGNDAYSTRVTDTSKFVRSGFKMSPSDVNSGNSIGIAIDGANTQYAYFDGFQINEITATEYATFSEAQLMEKYPYVDSYACLQNPYIEVRHDNLVRNGNCEEGIAWWVPFDPSTGTLSIENGKFKFVTTTYNNIGNVVNVKPNTNYYFSANKSGTNSNAQVVNMAETIALSTGGTFNTGSNTQVKVRMTNAGANTCYYDSFVLVEGTTAPASYKPCRIDRCVIEGKFTSDDTFTYENGKVSGLLNWKHRTLFGKDYDCAYNLDFAGSKQIAIANFLNNVNDTSLTKMIGYDGSIIPQIQIINGGNQGALYNGVVYLGLNDVTTGWGESFNPNADEVKAFMNGWKAVAYSGVRYVGWVSIVDGSLPTGAVTSLAVGTNTSGQKVINVTLGEGNTKFAVGDYIFIPGYGYDLIAAVSANSITVTNNLYTPVTNGMKIMKCDNGSTNTSLITWCKNNIAPGYEGYQLHYKLSNPEPITDVNVHIHGDIPKLDKGDNYVYVDTGMVLGEVANPLAADSYYRINSNYGLGGSATWLKSKAETINSVYRNQIRDSGWTVLSGSSSETNGQSSAFILATNYDVNAVYTVDYPILKTMHTTPTAITMQYQQDVLSAVSDLAEGLNSRQKADSALDTLVDESTYEYFNNIAWQGRFMNRSAVEARLTLTLKITPKKVLPILTFQPTQIVYFDGSTIANIPLSEFSFSVASPIISRNHIMIFASYVGSNSTIRAALFNNGGSISGNLTLDCRGRL
ncbi:phage tail protein [Anoxybacterium hadale]|uniref:Phage tail protein n=1 Tax=Anoxybacterium hadale TaxID=3408580 RepID=A0ACD1AB76_9FIRM|nr:phage tail protein [Clostridiales bacterium]